MLNIRDAVKALFGQGATREDIQAELDTLQVENLLDRLSQNGYLAADPEVREIASNFAFHDPAGLERLLAHPRPTPVTTTYTPPASVRDETEEAIQHYMQAHGIRYAEAALIVTSKNEV